MMTIIKQNKWQQNSILDFYMVENWYHFTISFYMLKGSENIIHK